MKPDPSTTEWEIWLDVHLSPAIAKWMHEYTGFTVKSAYALKFYSFDDFEIYKKAKSKGNVILISKDSDFNELISRLGSPPKLIFLKIGNCDNNVLWNFMKKNILQTLQLLISSDIDIAELE